MKTCTKCKQNKELNTFGKSKGNKDGYHSWCKVCVNAHHKTINFLPKLDISKECKICKVIKTANNYYFNKKHSDGLRVECKPCSIFKRDKDNYKSKYGITFNDYESILFNQNNSCKICLTTKPGSRINRFHVDHCHITGIVRGLLCENCNVALGKFKDNPEFLRKAASYLEDKLGVQ